MWVGPCDVHSPNPFPLCEQVPTPKAAPPQSILLPRSGSLSTAVRAATSLPPLSLSHSLDPSCPTTTRERLYRTTLVIPDAPWVVWDIFQLLFHGPQSATHLSIPHLQSSPPSSSLTPNCLRSFAQALCPAEMILCY